MMRSILRILPLFLLVAALTACNDKKNEPYFPPRADNRVYFIYMAGDNNLSYSPDAVTPNLNDIQNSATINNIGKGRVFVFCDKRGANTQLLEFKAGSNGKGQKTVLKEYGSNMNTASVATFREAILDMKAYATAGGKTVDSYILDVWSHGDAWETHSARSAGGIMPLSVANDGSSYLELEDFADAIEPGLFDAVVFAECYGASVEMLYLLREKTPLVLGSAPEMGVYGVPYDRVLPYVFAPVFDHEGYIDGYCDEYKDANSWNEPGGTMAAFDCTAFDDNFIGVMRNIYASMDYANAITQLTAASNASFGTGIGIQTFSNESTNSQPFKYFDIRDFVDYIYPSGSPLRTQFLACLNDIVLYKRTTGHVFEININPAFCGMSTYIMLENGFYNSGANSLNAKYRRTSWYNAAYSS